MFNMLRNLHIFLSKLPNCVKRSLKFVQIMKQPKLTDICLQITNFLLLFVMSTLLKTSLDHFKLVLFQFQCTFVSFLPSQQTLPFFFDLEQLVLFGVHCRLNKMKFSNLKKIHDFYTNFLFEYFSYLQQDWFSFLGGTSTHRSCGINDVAV